jgi:hypothetical protein
VLTSDARVSPVAVSDPGSSGAKAAPDEEGLVELSGPPDLLPLWFERALVVVIAAVVFFGAFGLLMAVLGHFSVLPVFLVGGVGTVIASIFAWPKRKSDGPAPLGVRLPAIGMCVIALGFLVWNGVDNGHYVSVDRDPGVYAAAGKWISSNGSLEVQAGKTWTAKGAELGAARPGANPVFDWSSIGMYPEGDGLLEFQFNHLAPVLFAEGESIGGDRLLFAMPALLGALGLCAVFAAGCRLVRRPWLVLAAVTALGLSLPQMSVARDTYSETTAQFLLWSGLWLLLTAYERRRLGVALLAGLAVAGTMLSRVDALVYLIPLPILGGVTLLAARSREDRRFLWRMYAAVVLGALPMTVLGTVDLMYRTGLYYTALHSQIALLRLGFAASMVGAVALLVAWPRLDALRRWTEQKRSALAGVAAGVAVIGLLAAWALRPALQHSRLVFNTTTATLQASEGLLLDPSRTYDEQTMNWMAWYLGAVPLVFAIVGIGLLLSRLIRRPAPAIVLLLAVAGIGTAMYLWTVQITPTQIWAMRRFVPAALPFLVLASAFAIDAGLSLLPRLGLSRAWMRLIPITAVVPVIAFPVGVVLPVRSFQSQSGFLSVIDKTCDTVGPNAAVIFVSDDPLGLTLTQTMRSYCGVPATKLIKAISADRLKTTAGRWQAEGRTLWVLGSTPEAIAQSTPGLSLSPSLVGAAANTLQLAETLSRPPTTYRTEVLQVYAAKVTG